MDGQCWFCLKPLGAGHRSTDRHHKVAKRYLSTPEKHDRSNIVLAHTDCHLAYHRTRDEVRHNRQQHLRYMQSINYGHGIFAAEPAYMAAD